MSMPAQPQTAPGAPGQTVTDTNNGFLVGVDPATPPQGGLVAGTAVSQSQGASEFPTAVPQAPQQQVPGVDPAQQQAPGQVPQGFFTAEDIERVRSEEKTKLYDRIEGMSSELTSLREAREAEAAEQERIRQEAEEARRREEESTMEVRDLLQRREAEWAEQLEAVRQDAEQARAIAEQERRLSEINDYKRQAIDQNAEYIMPQLRDLIRGNTVEQIDASIQEMRDRTSAIMADVREASVTPAPPAPRGIAPTGAPPVGPMEQASSYENLTAEDISNLTPEQYAQHRERLLRAANPYRG